MKKHIARRAAWTILASVSAFALSPMAHAQSAAKPKPAEDFRVRGDFNLQDSRLGPGRAERSVQFDAKTGKWGVKLGLGLPGWMDKVEKMKREQMDPLLKIATKDITTSSLVLEGLSSNKGTCPEPGFFAKKKAAALRFIKKRV